MMASPTASSVNARSLMNDMKSSIHSNTSVNLRGRLLSRTELKTSIPKPSPVRTRTPVSSKCSLPVQVRSSRILPSKIPKPVFRSVNREKTALSLSGKFEPVREHTKCPSAPSRVRPRSASVYRGPYANVKAKVDSKPPTITKLKSRFCPVNVRLEVTPDSSVTGDSHAVATNKRQTKALDKNQISNEDELLEKKKQLIKIYTELIKLQSSKEIPPEENEICRLMQNKTLDHIGDLAIENISLLPEDSPEFLSQFGKLIKEVTDMWLRLIGDVSNTLITASPEIPLNIVSTEVTNMRDELSNFFSSLPSNGDHLHTKLQQIEKELSKALAVVIHNGIALSQKNEELKDNCFRLEKTQDQINYELKEQIAILGQENEKLDKKYAKVVEMYNVEKASKEKLEKYRLIVNKENAEVRKILKVLERKCGEFEIKIKKEETTCKGLETLIRNKELMFMKENKNHRELLNKVNDFKATIKALQLQLSETNQNQAALEQENRNLQEELRNKTADLEKLEEKVKEANEELTVKNKKLSDTQEELNEIQANFSRGVHRLIGVKNIRDISPNVLIEDLSKENDQKDLQIQELRKKLDKMEYIMREKSSKEEELLAQVADLKRQPFEKEVLLNKEIQELKFQLKDVNETKERLERIAAQKSLELDQRDLMLREHAQILRAKDELVPMFQGHLRNERDNIDKLSAIVIEQHNTYFNQGDGKVTDVKAKLREMSDSMEKRFSLDPEMVNQELTFRQEKMSELYNVLEHKQMEMIRLEQRMRELQGIREEKEQMEREKEARISLLQRELEGQKTGKSRGIFSAFFGQDESV